MLQGNPGSKPMYFCQTIARGVWLDPRLYHKDTSPRLSGELPGYCGFGTFVELHPIIRWLAIHDRFQLGSLRMIPCAASYSWRLRSYRL
jgi:hypothetical protein